MRALILWAEPLSTNLGVRALAAGTARMLQRVHPGVEIQHQGFGPGDAPVRIGAFRPQARRLVSMRSDLLDWIRSFDVVVDTRAGDSFTDIYGLPRLRTMSTMSAMVRRGRVPLVMGPQTIGPFSSRQGTAIAALTLAASRLVMARDQVSFDASRRLGRAADVLTTDVVFSLDPPARDPRRDVIVNVSGLLWQQNGHVDADRYRQSVLDICRRLGSAGRQVSLLAHVLDSPLPDNDVPVARAVAQELGGVEVLVPNDLVEVREMLATAEVVIGSRMHACLNALSVGTPAVPLAYSRKFQPLLDGLGWSLTVDLRGGSDLVDQVVRAVEDPRLPGKVSGVLARAKERVHAAQVALSDAI